MASLRHIFLLLVAAWTGAQAQPPRVERFAAGASPYTAFTQDDRGFLYAAGPNGLLEYDGVRWRTVTTASQPTTLAWHAPSTRLYVGGNNTVGYLERNPAGQVQYRDLPLNETGAGITHSAAITDGLYFAAGKQIGRAHV